MNKTLHMMVGVPGSGKSTYIRDYLFTSLENPFILSTDAFIESVAAFQGITYSEAFEDNIKDATNDLNDDLNFIITYNYYENIIWDQTNLTIKSRAGKLAKIPNDWKKIAYFFPIPKDISTRLASRTDKIISSNIYENMVRSFQMPTVKEGFDKIVEVKNE